MKKLVIGVLIVALLLLTSLYIFIPNAVNIKSETVIHTSRSGLVRMLMDNNNWAKWWPGKSIVSQDSINPSLSYQGINYKVSSKNISQLQVLITGESTILNSVLYFISLKADSVKLVWETLLPTSYNPIKRFFAYQKAKQITTDLNTLLKTMENYFSNTENIYSSTIQQVLVNDTSLISTSGISKGYPSIAFIYSLIDKLKTYSLNQGAQQTNSPMLNINTTDSIKFTVKVALPVNKRLPDTNDIFYKWMMYGGKILVTEVKGDNNVTARALLQMSRYVSDFQMVAPAIPFYSLVTDRRIEPDSSKWITKVYYPVM